MTSLGNIVITTNEPVMVDALTRKERLVQITMESVLFNFPNKVVVVKPIFEYQEEDKFVPLAMESNPLVVIEFKEIADQEGNIPSDFRAKLAELVVSNMVTGSLFGLTSSTSYSIS